MRRTVLGALALAVAAAGVVAVVAGGDGEGLPGGGGGGGGAAGAAGGGGDLDFDGLPRGVDDGSRFTLMAGGDINVGRSIGRAVDKHGFDYVFNGIKPYFEGADLTFGNLEMVFTKRLEAKRNKSSHKKAWHIHARPDQVKTLHDMGVDLVSTANNHAYDYTCPGVVDTRKTLNDAGIVFSGTGETVDEARAPAITTVNGVKVGFLFFCATCSYIRAKSDRCGVSYLASSVKGFKASIKVLGKQIRELRKQVDIVFVSPHWGRPFHPGELGAGMVKLARAAIDAGAHGILGHGNHVYLGVEAYKGRPILYDMGNFLFDQWKFTAYTRQFLWRLEIDKTGVKSVELLPFVLPKNRKTRLPTDAEMAAMVERLGRRNNDSHGTVTRRADGRFFMDMTVPSGPPAGPKGS